MPDTSRIAPKRQPQVLQRSKQKQDAERLPPARHNHCFCAAARRRHQKSCSGAPEKPPKLRKVASERFRKTWFFQLSEHFYLSFLDLISYNGRQQCNWNCSNLVSQIMLAVGFQIRSKSLKCHMKCWFSDLCPTGCSDQRNREECFAPLLLRSCAPKTPEIMPRSPGEASEAQKSGCWKIQKNFIFSIVGTLLLSIFRFDFIEWKVSM